ncbi:zinc dependent phospholipase C family protein [Hymenobacter cellulosivorans]|uniref:Zinc dependent phospholipase C family protein n=1 Tax=Hymenobacter cellulosivorans TaxID=2932249 RepID=A0ABY4FGT7_9BACT|nr:zinc dependent phospholipase C family protein [Hymenobacter cellulosivorans]UOQ55336.1 zinc dependent phospholipase C family protein [Hymenobacter cellulosivorans]
MKKHVLTLAFVLLCPFFSSGWGFLAHRTINQVAVYTLPKSMQGFYYRHLPEIVRLSTAPDERREDDPKEAPKHYIDMDHFGDDPFGSMPKLWEKAVAKYSADTLRKYGTVPWIVLETKTALTEAFRQRDSVAIIRLSAELGHYVADAYVPLHTTENYDGQLTNQHGMHSLWESKIPERHLAEWKLDSEKAEYLKDPLRSIWTAVQESYGFLGDTFDKEEKVTRTFTNETKYTFSHKFGKTRRAYSDAFADAYYKEVGGQVAYRLKQAPTMVASMWLTAWQDAGKPDLDQLLGKKPSKEEKEKLALELKAWDKNELAAQDLLLATHKEKTVERPDQINSAQDMAPAPVETPTPAPVAAPAVPAAEPEKVKVKTKSDEGSTKRKEKKKKEDKKENDGWN